MAAEERWYFSREQLENTPSKKCGIDPEKELSYRQQAANFIQDMGQRLQVNQLCINTSIVYMHRFYMFHSFQKFHRNAISTCALFLAAKVEEQPRKLEHVIKVAHLCLHRDAPPLDPKNEAYLEQAQELVINENIMLQTLGFDVAIDHPHTHVVKCCQLVRGGWSSVHHASKDLAQTSYFMATNSLHLTTMCLQYKPTVVACVCIHLACKWANWEIPKSSEGKRWFWYVEKTVTEELLEELTAEFLAILDRCPSRLKRKMMSSTSGMEKMPDPSNYDKKSNADMGGSNRSPNASGSSSSGASASRGDRVDHFNTPLPALVRDNLFSKMGASSSKTANAVDKNGGPVPSSSSADRKQHKKDLPQNHPPHPSTSVNSANAASANPAFKHAAPPKTPPDHRHGSVAAAISSPSLTDFPPPSHNSTENFLQVPPSQPRPISPGNNNSSSAVKKLKPSSKEYRAPATTTTTTPNVESEKLLKQQQQPQHHHHHHHQRGGGDEKPQGPKQQQPQHHQGNHVGRSHRQPPAVKPPILTPSPPTPRDEDSFPIPKMDLSPLKRTLDNPAVAEVATPPTPLQPVACEALTALTPTKPHPLAVAKGDHHRRPVETPPQPQRRHEGKDSKERQIKPHKSKTPPVIPHVPEPQKPVEPVVPQPLLTAAMTPQPPISKPDIKRVAEQEISRTMAALVGQPPQPQPATAVVRNSSSSLNESALPPPPHSRLLLPPVPAAEPEAATATAALNAAAAAHPPRVTQESSDRHPIASTPKPPHQSSKKSKKSKSRDRDKERSHDKRDSSSSGSIPAIKLLIPKDRITSAVSAGGSKHSSEPAGPGSLKLKISKEKLHEGSMNSGSRPNSLAAAAATTLPVVAAAAPPPPPPPEMAAPSFKIKITKDRTGPTGTYNLSVGSDTNSGKPPPPVHESRKRERATAEEPEEPRPQKVTKQSARAARRSSGNGQHAIADVPPSSNTRSSSVSVSGGGGGGYPQALMHQQPQPPPHLQSRGRKGGAKPNMGMPHPYGHPQVNLNAGGGGGGGYPGFAPQFYPYAGPPPNMSNMPNFFMHQGHQGHPSEYVQHAGEYPHPGEYEYQHPHQQAYFNQFPPPPRMPPPRFQHPPPHPHQHPHMMQQQPQRPMHPPLPPPMHREPPLPREPPPAIPPPPPPE